MIRASLRKAAADARSRRLQTALLFVVMAAAAGTLMLALTVRSSASEPFARTIHETNSAHLWVTSSNPDVDLSQLAALPGVKAISGPYPQLWAGYSISNSEKKQQLFLVGMDERLPEVDHPAVTDGRWLRASDADEIVIDRGAALRMGVKAGDRIELLVDDHTVPLFVAGLAVPTGRAPVPIAEEGLAYVLRDTLQDIVPGGRVGSPSFFSERIGVQLTSDDAAPAFVAAAQGVLAQDGVRLLDSRDEIAADIEDANTFDVIFLGVFSIFALLAAGIIIANAMAGQILSQRRDIGLLKALGFTPLQVTLVFLAESLALALAASAAGVAAGLAIAPFFIRRTANMLGVTSAPLIEPAPIVITVVAMLGIVAVFTALATWNAGRVSTVQALTGKGKPRAHRSRLGAIATGLRLPVIVVLGIKDLSAHPARTVATTVALVLAVITATFTLGIEATFGTALRDPAMVGGAPADLVVDRDRYEPAAAVALLESRPEVANYIVRTDVDATFEGEDVELRGLEGDLTRWGWRFVAGAAPVAAGEVAVGQNMASEHGFDLGDVITVAIPETGARLELRVVGRYLELDENVMMLTRDTLPASFLPTDYYIDTVPGTDNSAFRRTLLQASGGNFDPEVMSESTAAVRRQMRGVILPLNAVLFGIAAINLLSTLMLGIRESQRDYAVFKALGLTPGQIATSVFAGSALLGAAAVAVGIPLGLAVTTVIFDGMSEAVNVGASVGTMPSASALALIVPGAIALAAIGSVLPARAAAAIRPTDALRYE